MPEVSICVATHRRPRGLSRLLDSLVRLELPPRLAVELVVVDNDAEGSARAVVRRWAASLPPLRYCLEPEANIAVARNRAVAEARGRWLAFVDDDEVACPDWLRAHWERARRTGCDGLFGPVLPRLEARVTPWLDAETFFGRPRHASGTRLGLADLRSGNAFLRRRLFEGPHARGFDPAFGRAGGSDSELFARLLAAGADFRWCDEAAVVETVPAERHRLSWLVRRAFRGGCVHTRLVRRGPLEAWLRPLAVLSGLLLVVPFAALGGRPALARLLLRAATQAGHLWALSGGTYEEYGAGSRVPHAPGRVAPVTDRT